MKQRVLHLISTDVFSGAENVACQIIKMFEADKEYEMCYCSVIGKNKEVLETKKINILELKKFNISNVKKAIKEYKPTIIHAHDAKSCVLAAIANSNKNIKIIAHIHGNHENMRKTTIKSFLFKTMSTKFKRIIWVSNSSIDEYRYKDKVIEKSIVITNVIDSNEIINKIKNTKKQNNFDLIYLGRMSYPKNPLRLIEILKQICEINSKIKIALVGNGELEAEVKGKIEEYNLKSNVSYLGFQSNPYEILNSSKMMIMTSRYEGTPMCALEAVALGKPIISTPTDGLKDIIEDGYNGFLCTTDDEFVENIIKIIEDKDLLTKMQKNMLSLNKKINNISEYKKRIANIYE